MTPRHGRKRAVNFASPLWGEGVRAPCPGHEVGVNPPYAFTSGTFGTEPRGVSPPPFGGRGLRGLEARRLRARSLALLAVSVLVIGLVDNFLTPQVMRSRLKIHPMLILLSILGGLHLFGAYGIFFGPIALSVTIALVDIYKKEFRSSVEQLNKEEG